MIVEIFPKQKYSPPVFFIPCESMTRNSQLSEPLPPVVQKVSTNLKRWGFWGFWTQLVFGVISTVTLLFATPAIFQGDRSLQAEQFGVFFCLCGSCIVDGSPCHCLSLWENR